MSANTDRTYTFTVKRSHLVSVAIGIASVAVVAVCVPLIANYTVAPAHAMPPFMNRTANQITCFGCHNSKHNIMAPNYQFDVNHLTSCGKGFKANGNQL